MGIGPETEIGAHAVIRGPTAIGHDKRIFPFSSVGEDPQGKKYAGELKRIAMANLSTNERLAPELVQAECFGDRLVAALQAFLHVPKRVSQIQGRGAEIHKSLHMDSNREAATSVLALLSCQ